MSEVSVIIPVFNAEKWLGECLQSVVDQRFNKTLQVSIFNDASSDSSKEKIHEFTEKLKKRDIDVVYTENKTDLPRGVGYAKNQAVKASAGRYLCFLDADDVMHPDRVSHQYQAAIGNPKSIIGSRFHRVPQDSTVRYTQWANRLTPQQMYLQVYTSHGPTLIMPTWFCSRQVYDLVGGFDEGGKGVPEDMIFFYKHLDLGGSLFRVDEDLLMYRYHPDATTFSIHEDTIWSLRVAYLQKNVLSKWSKFSIWNAGKQGKKLFKSLSKEYQNKVIEFCDVDEKKIKHGYYVYYESKETPKPQIPIVHFSAAQKPFVVCVKMDMTDGQLEKAIESLNLTEGVDYIHFN